MSEVLNFHTSTYSDPPNGGCVDVAETPTMAHVRDSKDVTIPGFTARAAAWMSLLEFAKSQDV